MNTVGGYFEYRGGVQYHGGYHDECGDIFSTVGVIFSTVRGVQYRGDIMMHVEDIMIHVGDIMSGGCSVLWGTQITKDFFPWY